MKLDSDDFELFGLPRRFALDRDGLDERWRALQAEVHPDRHAAQGAAAQQVRALMFIERFAADVDRRLEALGQ